MNVMTKPAAPATSHVKPTQLLSGTFVTTDLKRARRMCEGVLREAQGWPMPAKTVGMHPQVDAPPTQ